MDDNFTLLNATIAGMSNHLIHENSPYLLQHAHNPVDWYPWGPQALGEAQKQNKPIFLSIGYAACHWCHVMAHESFEDPAVAAIMNEHFINIKVDREERPDLDGIYMQAVVALIGSGGWPMSVFLTPQGAPFLGGTYFPPVQRYNMPAFRELLLAVAHTWQQDPARLLHNGQQLVDHLRAQAGGQELPSAANAAPMLNLAQTLDRAAMALAQAYDWTYGGWGKAPKFPQPMSIEFLLRRATRGDSLAADAALHALRAMAKGGMYDVVGGGFARYSTDDLWRTPHFEKMLYDNAQLATVYLHAWLIHGDPAFRQVCEETLDFVLREMRHPAGGFYSSLDADSEGEEGKFYLWTPQQIQAALGDVQDCRWILEAYGVTLEGNFEGGTILQRALSDAQLAEKFGAPVSSVPGRLQGLHRRLLEARQQRIRPATDDKVLVAWNALMLTAFAEAGRYLKRPDYLEAAQRGAGFLLSALRQEGRLLRSWRAAGDGRARHNAYLEDYAALSLALLALYQSDADPTWYAAALRLADEMMAHFRDPAGGFFDTRDDHEALLIRPKDLQDNATPSGSALAAGALLQLAAYEGNGEWRAQAEGMLAALQDSLGRYPTAFAQWLCAADFALGPVQEVALLGDAAQSQPLRDALWASYRPRLAAAISAYPPPPGSPALLHDRPLQDGLPTAYVCRDFVCLRPVTSPQEMLAQLDSRR